MTGYLLPIGSVVRLKDSTANVMVAGYLPIGDTDPGYVWDYSGFKFPLGYVHNDEIYCFDQNQIEEVLGIGYQDSEQFAFANALEAAVDRVKNETAENRDSDQEDEDV